MSTPAAPGAQPKTLADWLALPDDARGELIDGELVEKAAPTFDHGRAQSLTAGALAGAFHRRAGDGPVIALRAEAHEQVRAEPFDAIELSVGVLLGDDPA